MKRFSFFFCSVLLLFFLASCGKPVVKIGYVNPSTGALAGNGEGADWVCEQMYAYVQKNPIYIGGKQADFEIIMYDCKSDPKLCREHAERLVKHDKVDVLLALQTITMVIPEAAVAEELGIPCVSIQAPTDALAASRKSFDWTYHAFWTVDTIYTTYQGLWSASGHPKQSGAKIGFLFPDDPDGKLWSEVFARRAAEDGYVVVDPGRYPVGTRDFEQTAALFKRQQIAVLTGTNVPLDFIAAMDALLKAGVQVDSITMGRVSATQAATAALGQTGLNLGSAVWWNKNFGFTSELTGIDCKTIASQYAKDNFDEPFPQPAAYAYAALELAIHALKNAGSKNRKKLLDALSRLDVMTIVGPVCYNKQCGGLHYSETPLAGGQWQLENNELQLKVVDNAAYPTIPLEGTYKKENVTTESKN